MTRFIAWVMEPMSVVILDLVPVTPSDDTMYRNPSDSLAIMAILSCDVGATMEIRQSPCLRHAGAKSSFSS